MLRKEIAYPAPACCIPGLLTGCMALPENFAKKASFALTNAESTYLGEVLGRKLMDHADQSGVLLLGEGKQIVSEDEPYAGFLSKISVWMTRQLPVESFSDE